MTAAELNVTLLKTGRVLDVRWVASRLRTVLAVWTNHPALYKHFADAANDVKLNSKRRLSSSKLSSVLVNCLRISNFRP